jgi:hypothetical protein
VTPPGSIGAPPVTGTPTGTEVPPASRLTGLATLPPCGDGERPGPRCYSVLPGAAPSQDEVRQALYDAAVQNHFSFSLIEAISWQESGWQQNVKACDGGVGLMQLMPDTTTWLNTYYGRNDDPYTLAGNIMQGIELLQWTYSYYISFCNPQLPQGQTCNWDTVWPDATDGATIRDIVSSAYNEGIGTMAHYGIINWWYVNSVVNLWKQFLAAE